MFYLMGLAHDRAHRLRVVVLRKVAGGVQSKKLMSWPEFELATPAVASSKPE
jgi:hypothetical protein